jgi:hypothetical protein
MFRLFLFLALIFVFKTIEICAQQKPTPQTQTNVTAPIKTLGRKLDVRTTPAYAELIMKRTEIAADLDVLLPDYTEESPEVREKRLNLQILDSALKRLENVTLEQYLALTPAVGRMLARKLEAEAELKILSDIYTDEHPSVKKSKIRYKVFEAELKRLLLQTNSQ